ncbi:MAG: trigger factor [bacterium]
MNVKVEVEKREPWGRVLSIEVPAEDAEKEYEKVAARLAKRVRLPGFRKGKVPTNLVRKSFRQELEQEFLETIVPRAFGRALDETGIDPVTEPKFEELSFGEERPLSFKAEFEARPEFEVTGWEALKVEKEVPEVREEQIDSVLDDFRKGRADLEEVDRPAIDGDVVTVDYCALDDAGEPIPGQESTGYVIELGSGRVVEAFEAAVRGAGPGESRTAEVPYPADYPEESLAGTVARYRVTVKVVQEKRLPTLTDELVAEHTDVKTVDELRARVRTELEAEADRFATRRLEQTLLEKVVDANPFDAPKALVDGLLDDFIHQKKHEMQDAGQDPNSMDADAVREQNREAADRQVRRMLLLDALAKKGDVKVTEREVHERVQAMARMRGMPTRKLAEQLGGDRFLRRLSREIRDKKVLAFLVGNAEITEKKISAETAV